MEENERQNKIIKTNNDNNMLPVPRGADPVSQAMKDVMMRLTGIGYPSWIYSRVTWRLVLGILLLYLRYITSDLVRHIFSFASGNEIGKLKKKYEKNGCKYILSIKYSGQKVVYYLSQEGLEYYRSLLPIEHIKDARIPIKIGNVNTPKLWHDTDLRSLPCAYLMQGNKASITWYTSLHLFNGKKPVDCILSAISGDSDEPGNIIADAAIKMSDYVILAEQDTGTQTVQVIIDKINNYAMYFDSIQYKPCQLIFNINVHQKNEQRIKSRKCIFNNIHNLMQDHHLSTVDEAYVKIAELINNQHLQRHKNMARLLDDYYTCGGIGNAGINAVLDYLQPNEIEGEKNENRVSIIKNLIRNAYDNKEYVRQAVERGISLAVTGNIYRAAYYINPYDSGLLDELIERIKDEEPFVGGFQFTKARLIKMYSKYICRNVILVKNDKQIKDIYIVSEISADVANNIMMRDLLAESTKFQNPRHIYFVVSDQEEARKFARETRCIEKFHTHENIIIPKQEYKVTIRFIVYSSSGVGIGGLFVPNPDGTIVETEIL